MGLEELLEEAKQAYLNYKEEAFEMYRKLYDQYPTDPFIMNGLANCYCNGIGVETNREQAKVLYKMAAEAGCVDSMYNLAFELECDTDPEAIRWYEKAFEAGDEEAAYRLATIYDCDDLVPRNSDLKIDWLRKSADKQYGPAEVELGVEYLRGRDVEQDFQIGREWLFKAYEHGEGMAARNMSILYRNGDGVEADIQKAIEWAVNAAKCSNPNTEFCSEYARAYILGNAPLTKNITKALELFEISVANGDLDATEDLGIIYSNPSYGVPQNETRAIELFEKCAVFGKVKSINNLKDLYIKLYGNEGYKRYYSVMEEAANKGYYKGYVECFKLCSEGIGTKKDVDKALKYLEVAVEGEYPEALVLYGNIYMDGLLGKEKDKKKAVEYYIKAADKGHIEASFYAGLYYKDAYDISKNEEDKQKGCEYLEKAAEAGHSGAISNLAFEAFIDDDEQEGMKWLNIGVERNVYGCHNLLGDVYHDGLLNQTKDCKKAFELYSIAADKGCIFSAMFKTGKCYYFGDGTQKDYGKALKYFTEAEKNGQVEVKYFLGGMYHQGLGVSKDLYKARTLFNEYAENDSMDQKIRFVARYLTAEIDEELGRVDNAISTCKDIISKCNDEEIQGMCYFRMGYIYIKGVGVPEDMNLAKEYFHQSLQRGVEVEICRNNLNVIQKELQGRTINYNSTPQKQGCYVATAVYGSYDCPEVWMLRRFRDYRLSKTWYGRSFIKIYYAISPTLVKMFGDKKIFNIICKGGLDKFVAKLKVNGFEDSPYND